MEVAMESSLLGIELGPLVNLERYDSVGIALWDAFPGTGNKPSEFAMTAGLAWNNVGYRTKAAAEHRGTFKQRFECEPRHALEQQFQQINHFFGFVTNVTAAAESLVYAAYISLLGKRGEALVEKNLKSLRADQLKVLQAEAKFADIGKLLKTEFDHMNMWWEMRDVLMHRGQPNRHIYVGGPKDAKTMLVTNPKASPADWTDEFHFEEMCCDEPAEWLRKLISEVSLLLEKALK